MLLVFASVAGRSVHISELLFVSRQAELSRDCPVHSGHGVLIQDKERHDVTVAGRQALYATVGKSATAVIEGCSKAAVLSRSLVLAHICATIMLEAAAAESQVWESYLMMKVS